MARLLPKPTAISTSIPFSLELYNMVSSMILTKTRSGNSSASIATWRKNTPIMATSNYGFPTLLTRKN